MGDSDLAEDFQEFTLALGKFSQTWIDDSQQPDSWDNYIYVHINMIFCLQKVI